MLLGTTRRHAISRLAFCASTGGSVCVGREWNGITFTPSVHSRGHTGDMSWFGCNVHCLPGCCFDGSTARMLSADRNAWNCAHARLMVSAVRNGDVGRRMAKASQCGRFASACRTQKISASSSLCATVSGQMMASAPYRWAMLA